MEFDRRAGGWKRWFLVVFCLTFFTPRLCGQQLIQAWTAKHSGKIRSLVFSLDGTALAVGGKDGVVKVYDRETGKERKTLKEKEGAVFCLAFDPKGKKLAVCSGLLGSLRFTYDPLTSKYVLHEKESVGQIKIWDLQEGHFRTILSGAQAVVRSCVFSNGGKELVCVFDDGSIGSWNGSTFKRQKAKVRKTDLILSNLSPDAKHAAIARSHMLAELENAPGDLNVREVNGGRKWNLEHHPLVTSLAFSPDSRSLASASNSIKIWEVATGKKQKSLKGHKAGIWALTFSPDGKILASGSGIWKGGDFEKGEIKLWSLVTGKEIATVLAHSESVNFLTFSPDGTCLASASASGKEVILWKLGRKDPGN